MDKNAATGGPITRRAFDVLRRLPLPIQDEIFRAIERFAMFLLLIAAGNDDASRPVRPPP